MGRFEPGSVLYCDLWFCFPVGRLFFLHAVLRYLIAQNVSVEDGYGWSAAMDAIRHCAKCLEELLNKNTHVSEVRFHEHGCHGLRRSERCQDNFTLLHFAAQLDNLDAIDILSHHNVDSGIDSGHVGMTSSYHSSLAEKGACRQGSMLK